MLRVISLEQAFDLIDNRMGGAALPEETVPPAQACGRVLCRDIVGAENVPAFDRSTMDGFAVRAADTFGASETLPAMLKITGEVQMGVPAAFTLQPGECAKIPTGGMLPAGADAVVPVEDTGPADGLCLCYRSVSPLQYVTRAGDDVTAGQTVLPKGTLLTPAAVGVLAAMGVTAAPVYRRPRVGVISTGNELVPAEETPRAGEVRDVNGPLLAALCGSYGCECTGYGIVKDDETLLAEAVSRAIEENDLVLLSGGSSAGEADSTAAVFARLGEVLCHGIAVKPGKPTVLGKIGEKAVFGLPGHPAACCFMASLLVRRHIRNLTQTAARERTVPAALTEHVSSNHGRAELLCVRLHDGAAEPVYGKSGVISQLSAADGYILIPRDCEGLRAGETVDVYLF